MVTFRYKFLLRPVLVLALLFCGSMNAAFAQVTEPAAYKSLIPKFKKFYNAGQADSLFSLFDDKMQSALPPDKTRQMISQLQGQLGELQTAISAESTSSSVSYKATFSKAVVLMLVSLDAQGNMRGLFFQPYKEKEGVKRASGLTETEEALDVKGGKLYGSLILPDKISTPVPLVIVVAGSGPTDRNGNSPLGINAGSYRYLSNALGEKGLATFLFDKRMIGKSAVNQKEADLRFYDYVSDLILWIKKLKADKRFSGIILAGHSEGSLVSILAAEKEPVNGFISIAGSGRPIKDVLKEQLNTGNNLALGAKLDSLSTGFPVSAKADDGLLRPDVQPYLISWMKIDPAAEIRKLSIPVLIIQGSIDQQVRVADAERLKKAAKKATLKLIPGMNHVLKEAPAGREENLATYKNPDLPLQKELAPAIVTFASSLK